MNVSYRDMISADIPAILEISSLQLGKSYLSETELNTLLEKKEVKLPIVVSENTVIGYSIIHLIPMKQLLEELEEYRDALSIFDPSYIIQYRKSTAIHPSFTKKRIGYEFIRHTMKKYEEGTDIIMSLNWKRGNQTPVAGISEKLGMRVFAELKEFWKEDSLNYNFVCPECGKPPCLCSAVLYIKKSREGN